MSGAYGKTPKYVSPFVADALYRAKLRANNTSKAKNQNHRRPGSIRESEEPGSGSGWNSSVSRNALFDPTLHKQDIFKLTPRRPHLRDVGRDNQGREIRLHDGQHSTNRQDEGDSSDKDDTNRANGGVRMTRRRPETSPPRHVRSYRPSTLANENGSMRQSADLSVENEGRTVVSHFTVQDLRQPYVKVCAACHGGGGPHTHHSHAHTQHRSPARKSSPARSRSAPTRERPPLHQKGQHYDNVLYGGDRIAPHGNRTRLSQDSLISRARAEQDDSNGDVIRVTTRATSPIDDTTLQYLQEGREASWVVLSGLEQRQPDPSLLPYNRGHLSLSDVQSHRPMMPEQPDFRTTPVVPRSAFSPHSAAHKAPPNTPYNFVESVAGTPAHNFNIPKFQSSLDQMELKEIPFSGGVGLEDIYKIQLHAQTHVIESIAKMVQTIAGLNKKDKKRRRRRFRMNQPITVNIGHDAATGHKQHLSIGIDGSCYRENGENASGLGPDGDAPLSKAAIMDLILAKLQNLDILEKNIASEVFGASFTSDRGDDVASTLNEGSEQVDLDAITSRDVVPDLMSLLQPQTTMSPEKNKHPQFNASNAANNAPSFILAPVDARPDNISIIDPNLKLTSVQPTCDDPNLETAVYDKERMHEFRKFVKDLENAKAQREIPFNAHGITMKDAVERFSDSLFEEFVDSISKEVSKTLDAYAEELFDAI